MDPSKLRVSIDLLKKLSDLKDVGQNLYDFAEISDSELGKLSCDLGSLLYEAREAIDFLEDRLIELRILEELRLKCSAL